MYRWIFLQSGMGNAYITISDPAIIGGYYMQAIKKCGKRPFLVRTGIGTENGLNLMKL